MENAQSKWHLTRNARVIVLASFVVGAILGYGTSDKSFFPKKCGSDSKFGMMRGDYDQKYNKESSGMHGAMQGMMMDISGKTGNDLDKAFLEQMIIHHEGAVSMARTLKAGTSRPELKKMADDIISVQTKEIEMMNSWKNQWFPTN